MAISTYPNAVDQLCGILLSTSTPSFHFLISMTFLFRLANSQDTHPTLLSNKVLHKVLDASNIAVLSYGISYELSR